MVKSFYKKLVKKMSFLIKTHQFDIHEKLDEQNERLIKIEKLLIQHYEDDML